MYETLASMHKRCFHIIKKLENLGNTISNQDCANKVLRLYEGKWQPKVTTIKESNELKTLDISTIYTKMNSSWKGSKQWRKYEKEIKANYILEGLLCHGKN